MSLDRYVEEDCGFGSPCWTWQGCKNDGYGRAWANGRHIYAHRLFYEMRHGTIPPGLQTDHLCRNRACVNPEHLELVSNAVNTQRGIATKLSEDDVRAIRESPFGYKKLAREYGVTPSSIRAVKRRETWKDVA